MPGRRTPPTPERSPTWRSRALTRVPRAVPRAGVDDQAGRLVHDDEMGVLVHHVDRDVLGLGLGGHGGRHGDEDRLPGAHPGRRPGGPAVDEDPALVDEDPEPGAGKRGQAAREPHVEPQAAASSPARDLVPLRSGSRSAQ
jgi:hypothetical protein